MNVPAGVERRCGLSLRTELEGYEDVVKSEDAKPAGISRCGFKDLNMAAEAIWRRESYKPRQ